MWPFDRRQRLRRKILLGTLSKYLSPEAIDSLVQNPIRPGRDLRAAEIDFLVLQVRDDVLEDVPKLLESPFRIVMDFDGTIWSVMSSVVNVVFGIPVGDGKDDHADRCARAAARLVEELGSNVRVVFGTAKGLHGAMGSEQRLVYGAVVPNFASILERLIKLEFGRLTRISCVMDEAGQ
jgi:hypothetical protein